MKSLWNWIPNLWSNGISAFGTVLTTVVGCTLVLLFGVDLTGWNINPYAGALLMVALPALFVLGLLLIPLGMWIARRRARSGLPSVGESVASLFTTKSGHRKLLVIGGLTLLNIVILGAAGHRAMAWMDSPTFCGTACHEVMQPEYESYRESPHARVACVECHIGPGATFFVRSKVDGLRQVWRTITDTYTRPVPTPVHTLRPSRDTCEKCHWPDHFHGDRLVFRLHTRADEANTQEANVLLLKVGGLDKAKGEYHGIHWHVSRDMEVRYEALDEKREVIGKVTVLKGGNVVREYLPPEGVQGQATDTRTMDCIDCHNRPTHVFDLGPAAALDRGFAQGLLDPSVRWLRAVAEPLLARGDLKRDEAEATFRRDLEAAYRRDHADAVPEAAQLDAAAKGLATLWLANIYPARGVTWETYITHIGHKSSDPARHGCYRCHDDKHKTADGKVLSGECEICHEMVAQEEVVKDLDESLRLLIRSSKK